MALDHTAVDVTVVWYRLYITVRLRPRLREARMSPSKFIVEVCVIVAYAGVRADEVRKAIEDANASLTRDIWN